MDKEYEKVGSITIDRESTNTIPLGATHFELEIDTSSCYYQGDAWPNDSDTSPDYIIHFYKKKQS